MARARARARARTRARATAMTISDVGILDVGNICWDDDGNVDIAPIGVILS